MKLKQTLSVEVKKNILGVFIVLACWKQNERNKKLWYIQYWHGLPVLCRPRPQCRTSQRWPAAPASEPPATESPLHHRCIHKGSTMRFSNNSYTCSSVWQSRSHSEETAPAPADKLTTFLNFWMQFDIFLNKCSCLQCFKI